MQTKNERVLKLAGEIIDLLHNHKSRHEASDALEIAKVLLRPVSIDKSQPSPVMPSTSQT